MRGLFSGLLLNSETQLSDHTDTESVLGGWLLSPGWTCADRTPATTQTGQLSPGALPPKPRGQGDQLLSAEATQGSWQRRPRQMAPGAHCQSCCLGGPGQKKVKGKYTQCVNVGKVPVFTPVEEVPLADVSLACHRPSIPLSLSALSKLRF